MAVIAAANPRVAYRVTNSATRFGLTPDGWYWGLLRRRSCLVPTWRGWLLGGAVLVMAFVFVGKGAHSFLALSDPLPGGGLVVEGWVPDYALEAAVTEFKKHSYSKLFVTGGPLEKGAPLSEYRTYADLGAVTLLRMGLTTNDVQAVPAPMVRKDRTYASAAALKHWLREHGMVATNLNVITLDAHSRRTRLLFQKALGGDTQVGIVAIDNQDYDPKDWWKSSQGVRVVLNEMIAYGYARFLFRTSAQ